MPTDPQLRKMAETMKASRSRLRTGDSAKLYAQASHSIPAMTSVRSSQNPGAMSFMSKKMVVYIVSVSYEYQDESYVVGVFQSLDKAFFEGAGQNKSEVLKFQEITKQFENGIDRVSFRPTCDKYIIEKMEVQ